MRPVPLTTQQQVVVCGALVLLLGSSVSYAETLIGRVVGVHDGDTVTVLDQFNKQHKIRLAGIDAPELGQAFGRASRNHLAKLITGKPVTIEWHKRDKYRRIVGKVRQAKADAGLEQIRAGWAWHYKRYEQEQPEEDRTGYAGAQVTARGMRFGLWADDRAVAPWDYRKLASKAK